MGWFVCLFCFCFSFLLSVVVVDCLFVFVLFFVGCFLGGFFVVVVFLGG